MQLEIRAIIIPHMTPAKKALRITSSLGLLLAVAVGLWQRQAIYDWWRLRDYTPAAAIAKLADDTTMDQDSRRLFYVYHPQLDDKGNFNQNCGADGREHTIVLGCYLENHGIYLLDVTDPRLAGVEEVTAAHELLHAQYDRLSSKERKRVNELINQAYSVVTDERIRTTIEEYKIAGADVTNELHSILGTEVRILPAGLEEYYQNFFRDRQKIVAYSEAYQAAFTERKDKVAAYDAQLADLKAQIEENENNIKFLSQTLSSERDAVESGGSQNQVDAYNQKVRDYNSLLASTKKLISQYNQLVAERNQIALEEQELFNAIDSNSFNTVPSR